MYNVSCFIFHSRDILSLIKLCNDMMYSFQTSGSYDFEKVLRRVIREEVPGLLKPLLSRSIQENNTLHPLMCTTTEGIADQVKEVKAECLTDETKTLSTVHAHERPVEVFDEHSAQPYWRTLGQTMPDICIIKPFKASTRNRDIFEKASDHENVSLQEIHINNRDPHIRPSEYFYFFEPSENKEKLTSLTTRIIEISHSCCLIPIYVK